MTSTRPRLCLAFATVAATLLAPVVSFAGDDAAPNYAESTLSGDWGGLRTTLWAKGIAISAGLKTDFHHNSGGIRAGSEKLSHLDLTVDVDLEKHRGLSGLSARLRVIDDRGGFANGRRTGSLLGVDNIEVPVPTAKVFEAWVQQDLFDGALSLRGGLYPLDTEFSVLDSAGVFIQPPYGATADIALTRGPSIFNTSAFGIRSRWKGEGIYAMAAVLDGIPGDPNNPHGTHIRFDKGDGSFWIAEAGIAPGVEGRIEKYAAGFWRYTTHADDLVDVDTAGMPVRRLSHGWYVLAEKTLYRGEDRGIDAFARYSRTDGDSSAIRSALNLGMSMTGLIPGRGDDIFGIGYTRGTISRKYALTLAAPVSAESAVEITYRIPLTPWLWLQPTL